MRYFDANDIYIDYIRFYNEYRKEVISKYNVLKILSFIYYWYGIFNLDLKLNMKLKSFWKRI